MKKSVVLFALSILITNISFAAIDEAKTSDIDTLRAQGYSESALRVIDTVKYHNQGVNGKYQKRFNVAKKPSPYHRLKLYVDPTQEDDLFGEHQVNFTNTWDGEETSYTTQKVENAPIENL